MLENSTINLTPLSIGYQSTKNSHQEVLHKRATPQLKRLLQKSNQLNMLQHSFINHGCITNLFLIVIALHLRYKSFVNRNENTGQWT